MTTIDLEKTLIRENKTIATPKELLLIREFDRHEKFVENDALSRIGINAQVKEGKFLKTKFNERQNETFKFNQERVFHISQIKSLCEKYYLRFLAAHYYKGSIDEELPNKITNFEIDYDEKCDNRNTFIIAPAESFNLQEHPKDPLLFYSINDEYYYLIHKWGNDLSLFRRIKSIFSNHIISLIAVSFVFTIPLLLINSIAYFVVSGVILFAIGLCNLLSLGDFDDYFRLHKLNNWNSKHI